MNIFERHRLGAYMAAAEGVILVTLDRYDSSAVMLDLQAAYRLAKIAGSEMFQGLNLNRVAGARAVRHRLNAGRPDSQATPSLCLTGGRAGADARLSWQIAYLCK